MGILLGQVRGVGEVAVSAPSYWENRRGGAVRPAGVKVSGVSNAREQACIQCGADAIESVCLVGHGGNLCLVADAPLCRVQHKVGGRRSAALRIACDGLNGYREQA